MTLEGKPLDLTWHALISVDTAGSSLRQVRSVPGLLRRAAQGTLVLLPIFLAGATAAAQPFEQAGVRAQGMGGAFVAVADDASAVWWNPAGLADGPFFNLLVERQQDDDSRSSVNAFAIGTPPLGFSYQRLRYAVPPEAIAPSDREHRSGDPRASTFVAHEAGVTLLQTVTDGLVIGSTLKFVRGIAGDRATSRVDLDLGIQYRMGSVRAGLTARHLTEPSFNLPEGEELERPRQVRGGLAWTAPDSTTLAADLDLTEQEGTSPGRRLAVGAERQWRRRVAARAGIRIRTSDGPDPWVSLGGSYAVKPGVWLDGFWGRGEEQDARWGVSGRLTY